MFVQGEIREFRRNGRVGDGVHYVVVLSDTRFNEGDFPFVIAAPVTRRDYGLPLHVAIDPPPPGVARAYVMVEALGQIDKAHLGAAVGMLTSSQYRQIEECLTALLHL